MFSKLASATILVALLALCRGCPLPEEGHKADNAGSSEFRLGIVVSPLMSHKVIREIGIHWKILNLHEGDRFVLYDGEPEVNGTEAIYSFEPKTLQGFHKTGISGEFVATSALTFRDRCLKYHVAWIGNGTVRRTRCLATHPNWMSEKKSILGSKKLSEIFIPGTHDSGAYYKNDQAKLETLVDKYVITQDEDVLSQLIYGVRYLDIRVGRYPGTEDLWWVNHGYFSIHPLILVINDVKTFLNNTQEIVIFDVQEFPVGFAGNASKMHNDLVTYLEEKFAGYYLPKNNTKGWATSLEEIWATGKRLIIGYDNAEVWPSHDSTWSPVSHRWPNVKTLDDLYNKIDRYENRNQLNEADDRPPNSVMAQLTPDVMDALLDSLGGLRQMAELVNMNVTDCYHDLWRCNANIVSMDYIKSSGIIEAALEINDKKLSIC